MESAAPSPEIARRVRTIPEWWPHVVLGVASALLLSLLVTMLYYANSARGLLTDLQEYAWQVDKIDALLIQLLNAETGARGFLVTGDSDYLTPYRDSVRRMGALLDDIEHNPNKPRLNREDYTRVKDLIDAELAALSAAIDARQSNTAPPTWLMERGNNMMNALRDTLSTLRSRLSSDNATYYVRSLSFLGQSRWIVISLFTGAFALLLFTFVLIQKQAVLRRNLADMMSNEYERLERLVKQRTVELNDLASYLTRVSEAEKRHIARELHDEMGALLTAARMDVSWIMRDLDPALREKYTRRLTRLSESLDSAISLKRKITTDLKPPLLQELGLIDSVRALAEDLGVDGTHVVSLDLPEELPELDDEKKLAIFRIIQESLTNVRKYARADHVEVSMRHGNGMIEIEISDDGQGFDPDRVGSGRHGILGMRHRAQMFGGDLQVRSETGRGTRIQARIPA